MRTVVYKNRPTRQFSQQEIRQPESRPQEPLHFGVRALTLRSKYFYL